MIFPVAMVQCSFCKSAGHTVRTCKAIGVEEERQKRAADPKVIAQKKKAAAKRAERNEAEGKRLQLTKDPKSLHVPEVIPGYIKEEFGEKAKTVRGSIQIALPKEYLLKVLGVINENRFAS